MVGFRAGIEFYTDDVYVLYRRYDIRSVAFENSCKIILVTAGIMAWVGFYNVSKINENGIAALYLTYGILAGLGIGIGYNAVISVVNEWFTDKKGPVQVH